MMADWTTIYLRSKDLNLWDQFNKVSALLFFFEISMLEHTKGLLWFHFALFEYLSNTPNGNITNKNIYLPHALLKLVELFTLNIFRV